jgi:hypothetical protein
MVRQSLRSVFEAFNSRGYHANGIDIVRPSDKSTDKVSSVMFRLWILGISSSSIVKEVIPSCQQLLLMLMHQKSVHLSQVPEYSYVTKVA